MVKIAKTGAVICPQCNKEERLNFEEQKAQASYERNEEKKRLYYLDGQRAKIRNVRQF